MNKIYCLTLDIKNPDIPFKIERSIGVQSGDLIQVFAKFQLELIRFLTEMHEDEMIKKYDDDIPF